MSDDLHNHWGTILFILTKSDKSRYSPQSTISFEKSMSPKQLLIVMKSPAISNTTTKITLFPYKKKTKVSQNVEFNIVYETR